MYVVQWTFDFHFRFQPDLHFRFPFPFAFAFKRSNYSFFRQIENQTLILTQRFEVLLQFNCLRFHFYSNGSNLYLYQSKAKH